MSRGRELDAHLFLISGSVLVPTDGEIVQTAQRYVEAAVTQDGWRSLQPPTTWLATRAYQNSYTFLRAPPKVPRCETRTPLPDWGHAIDDGKMLSMDKLEEFSSADFGQLRGLRRSRPIANEDVAAESGEFYISASMDDLLPQPHYQPAEIISLPKANCVVSMIPNHPIFAYLHASAQETLKSRWSRSTWLIPIRGDFTRLDSRLSRGVIVSNGGLLSKSGTTIYWRELSVRAFWEYLAGTRGSGKFGSIGLSFEATDNAHDPKRRRSNVFSKYCIKVYHDSCYSTQIRTLIDRFKCAEDNDSEAGSGSAKVVGPKDNVKRRILRRAKLLLLNERGDVAPVVSCSGDISEVISAIQQGPGSNPAGVFCVTTGLYALKVRYPTSFRIPTLFESSPTTSSRLTTTTITSARSASVTSSPTPTPSHTTMATPLPATLSQFLVDNKRRFLEDLKKDAGANWTIVMGNEAGDLDSAASAIAYSFLAQPSLTIALLQSYRRDLHLRPENIYAFGLAHLDPTNTDLLCLDDLPIPPSNISSSLALVDHNHISSTWKTTDPAKPRSVVGIIDHHQDEQLYPNANPRIVIEGIGSCASLVANHFKDAWTRLSPPPEVASLLLASIAIDTNGLAEDGKAKPQDHEAHDLILSKSIFAPRDPSHVVVSGEPHRMTMDELTKVLKEKKFDVGRLTTRDLLRRDYKEFEYGPPLAKPVRLGLSTVPLALEPWLEKDPAVSFAAALEEWRKERNLDIVGVLNSYKSKKGKDRRQILVFDSGKDLALRGKLYAGLEADEALQLTALELDDLTDKFESIRSWTQGNNKASRKLIAPAFRRILEAA